MQTFVAPHHINTTEKLRVKSITELFAAYAIDTLQDYFADDIVWHLLGDEPIVGKTVFCNLLREMSDNTAKTLTISSVVVESNEAAVRGEMVLKDNSIFEFADFYVFDSEQLNVINTIHSFVVQKS